MTDLSARDHLQKLLSAIEAHCRESTISHSLNCAYIEAAAFLADSAPRNSDSDSLIDALVVCIQALPEPTADDYALESIDKGRALVRRALERLQELEGGNG